MIERFTTRKLGALTVVVLEEMEDKIINNNKGR